MRFPAALLFGTAALATLAVAAPSRADGLHWDIGLGAGVNKRVLTSKPFAGSDDAGFGPALALEGHFALFPLLRVGAYVTGELSPQGGIPMREMLAGGARVKIVPPWPRTDLRVFASVGVGYVGVYAPKYTLNVQAPSGGRVDATVDGAGGGYLEIPITIGVSYKIRKPLFLFAELWARFGMGFSGSYYGGGGGGRSLFGQGVDGQVVAPVGNDLFGMGLTLGLGFDL